MANTDEQAAVWKHARELLTAPAPLWDSRPDLRPAIQEVMDEQHLDRRNAELVVLTMLNDATREALGYKAPSAPAAPNDVAIVEWVSFATSFDEDRGIVYEVGGVYSSPPTSDRELENRGRWLEPSEPLAMCPRCGQRFAALGHLTAEACRDLHVDWYKAFPSICRRRARPAVGAAACRSSRR